MVSVTVGLVFHSKPEQINQIIRSLEERYGIKVVAVKQSWGRIWLKVGDEP